MKRHRTGRPHRRKNDYHPANLTCVPRNEIGVFNESIFDLYPIASSVCLYYYNILITFRSIARVYIYVRKSKFLGIILLSTFRSARGCSERQDRRLVPRDNTRVLHECLNCSMNSSLRPDLSRKKVLASVMHSAIPLYHLCCHVIIHAFVSLTDARLVFVNVRVEACLRVYKARASSRVLSQRKQAVVCAKYR